ncbi:hypothetical protein GFD24_02965 [Bifidobacterium ramosum]|uniref:Uncharacterized protein n=1 Tax=Bifidobacterium ramosum TaxID=1798158 RepID=A0A7K3T9J2_9BIFI|nr:hypothetical protein [Bifidobacterium ramosum]
MPWLIPPHDFTVVVPTARAAGDRRPSAAGYHSRPPSANWEISTLGPRVPTVCAAIALMA